MAPVRVARAFRLPIITAMTALALSGCMHTTSPVATAQPQSDLDTMAYGQPYYQAPAATVTSASNSGGAIAALRASFAASPGSYAPAQYAPAQAAYAAAPMPMPMAYDAAYRLDAGDKLRVVVYGQEGLTNTYAIDAGGSITLPLIGPVPARGRTAAGLAAEITGRLRNGYIRDPSVAVEIESYRPFFILGEVAAPGQYPYVPNMSVESAVAIAGGFSPRARRDRVTLTHTDGSGPMRVVVPLGTAVGPGDTVLVGERWF
jgi:polysaccharide export outer membrane protein